MNKQQNKPLFIAIHEGLLTPEGGTAKLIWRAHPQTPFCLYCSAYTPLAFSTKLNLARKICTDLLYTDKPNH